MLGHLPSPSHVTPKTCRQMQPQLTFQAALAGSRRQPPLHQQPHAPTPALAAHPPAPPSQLAQWCWRLVHGCKAQEGAHEKGFPPKFPPPTFFTVVFSDARLDPPGKHNIVEKRTPISLVPPASPKGRRAAGGRKKLPVQLDILRPNSDPKDTSKIHSAPPSKATEDSSVGQRSQASRHIIPWLQDRHRGHGSCSLGARQESLKRDLLRTQQDLSPPPLGATHLLASLRASWASIKN